MFDFSKRRELTPDEIDLLERGAQTGFEFYSGRPHEAEILLMLYRADSFADDLSRYTNAEACHTAAEDWRKFFQIKEWLKNHEC